MLVYSVVNIISLTHCFLNELTEQATGKQVIALPIEATALGNLVIQMRAADNN